MSYYMSERLSAFRVLSKGRVSLVVSGCLLMSSVSLAAPVGEEKWGAQIDIEGKGGSKRNLGEADLFLPLSQDARTLLFADIRTRMDNQSSHEGNFGLGVRHMLESGWNVGGYGYFDRRRSKYDNFFNQMTVGAEALSLDWDFRVNGYVPVGRKSYNEESFNAAEISGSSVIFRGGEERSLGGFDAEIGWRLPLFAADAGEQLRVYAGGYRFADEGVPMVAGPRGRAEMVFDELPYLWTGSRLSVGAELQNDDPRGTQGFLSVRLRIPLQSETKSSRLTLMERRMTDSIVRDIDVVTQTGAFGATETVTQTSGGQTITVLDSATITTTAALNTALTTAGASTVILSGTFNTNAQVNMAAGQTLMGSGSLMVRSASGRTATVSLPSATIAATANSALNALAMANNATLIGMTVTNGYSAGSGNAVNAQGMTGVTIRNSTLTATGTNGAYTLDARTTTNAVIAGNTITANPSAFGASGIRTESANNITIADNTIATTVTPSNKYTITGNNWTVFNTAGSTGNVAVGGTCFFVGAPTGSVGFTNGTTCP